MDLSAERRLMLKKSSKSSEAKGTYFIKPYDGLLHTLLCSSQHVAANQNELEEFKGNAPVLSRAKSCDEHFKTPNIQLYSNEAEERDQLLRNVEYTLLLKLSDNLVDGYSGSIKIKFDVTDVVGATNKLFIDF